MLGGGQRIPGCWVPSLLFAKRQAMNRARAWIVVIMVALACVIAVAWLLHPRSTVLFDRATRVAKYDEEPGRISGLYWWVSSHQVVLAHSFHDTLQSLYCHDTNTGKDDLCMPLNRLIQAQKSGPRIEALSPDRRVLLLWGFNERGEYDRQIGATLDGQLLFVDRTTGPADECYMADGSRWVEPICGPGIHPKESRIARLLIHDGASHTIVKTVTFNPWIDDGLDETITKGNHFLMQPHDDSGGFGMLPTSNARLQTIDIDLNASAPKPQTLTVNLPQGSEPYDVCYSPDGERVAFLRELDNHRNEWLPPLLQGWWNRLFPPPLPYKVSLWVSDLRGQKMHEVGSVPHDNTFSLGDKDDPGSIQWLPDGKTLSFLARGSVWTVPAD